MLLTYRMFHKLCRDFVRPFTYRKRDEMSWKLYELLPWFAPFSGTVRFAFSEVAPSPNFPSLNASVYSTCFFYRCRSVTLERVRYKRNSLNARSLNTNLTVANSLERDWSASIEEKRARHARIQRRKIRRRSDFAKCKPDCTDYWQWSRGWKMRQKSQRQRVTSGSLSTQVERTPYLIYKLYIARAPIVQLVYQFVAFHKAEISRANGVCLLWSIKLVVKLSKSITKLSAPSLCDLGLVFQLRF